MSFQWYSEANSDARTFSTKYISQDKWSDNVIVVCRNVGELKWYWNWNIHAFLIIQRTLKFYKIFVSDASAKAYIPNSKTKIHIQKGCVRPFSLLKHISKQYRRFAFGSITIIEIKIRISSWGVLSMMTAGYDLVYGLNKLGLISTPMNMDNCFFIQFLMVFSHYYFCGVFWWSRSCFASVMQTLHVNSFPLKSLYNSWYTLQCAQISQSQLRSHDLFTRWLVCCADNTCTSTQTLIYGPQWPTL